MYISCYRFEALYAKNIPESIVGEEFSKNYGDHNDPVTVIDPKRTYFVRAPVCHPIYENFRVKVCQRILIAYLIVWRIEFLCIRIGPVFCSYFLLCER